MKNLKSILGLGIMFLALNGMAQEHRKGEMSKDPAERAEQQTEKMTQLLGLDDDQKRKIQSVNTKYAEQVYVIKKENRDNQEAAKAELKKLRKDQDTEIKSVLNEKQIAMWEEHKQERKQKQQKQKGQQKEASPEKK